VSWQRITVVCVLYAVAFVLFGLYAVALADPILGATP
jgi:hypothetical protein